MDSDKYKDVIIQGFDAHAHFTSGERYVGGKANWDLDDDPEFLLDITSPRYQACLQRAHELKEQYPLTANISRAPASPPPRDSSNAHSASRIRSHRHVPRSRSNEKIVSDRSP